MPLELRKVAQSEEEEDMERELSALSLRLMPVSLQVPAAAVASSCTLAKATPLSSEPEMISLVPK
jgi:hypothetical protein